jgi:acyl-[acyl-carrier-protein] desaturase
MAVIARGSSPHPELAGDRDPVLEQAASKIAVDEGAHYSFFLEITRLYLYYFPTRTLEALHDVIEHFAMPGVSLVPTMDRFADALYRTGIYGPRQYARDVLQVVFENLDIQSRRALEAGVRRSRQVPDGDGRDRDTSLFSALDHRAVGAAVRRLFSRVGAYEQEIGLADVDPTEFVPSGIVPPE